MLNTERRQSTRYRLQDGSLATNSTILGPILDISMHGMSFEYYGDDLDDAELMDVGIFISKSKTLLTGLHGRVIRDQVIKNGSDFLPVIQKMRAIEFLALSNEQQGRIHRIIETQNTGSS